MSNSTIKHIAKTPSFTPKIRQKQLTIENEILEGDCLDHLTSLPRGSVDLVFADPPFNIGFDYDFYHDKRSKIDYLKWTTAWIEALEPLLTKQASIFVAIGDEYAAEMKIQLDRMGWHFRNWIIWHYTFGVHCRTKFSRSHAHIFYYVVNPNEFTFNEEAIRVPSARQLVYADRRANPRGKLPDDTWVLRPQDEEKSFSDSMDSWYIPRVCGTFKERQKQKNEKRSAHPCQMPEAILSRIIKVASNPGDLVLDPFAGSGTTLAVAKQLNRRFLGIELSPDYCQTIKNRLKSITTPCFESISKTDGKSS